MLLACTYSLLQFPWLWVCCGWLRGMEENCFLCQLSSTGGLVLCLLAQIGLGMVRMYCLGSMCDSSYFFFLVLSSLAHESPWIWVQPAPLVLPKNRAWCVLFTAVALGSILLKGVSSPSLELLLLVLRMKHTILPAFHYNSDEVFTVIVWTEMHYVFFCTSHPIFCWVVIVLM